MRKILFVLILSLMLFCGCSDGITTPEEENKVIEVSSENWDKEVIKADFAMVDFYADWCSPCKQLAPIVEELARENPGLKVCKLDIDENRKIYVKYKIRGIPTLIFFRKGEEFDRIIGLKEKAFIQRKIDSLLKSEEKRERKDRKKKGCEGGTCPPPDGY